LQANYINDLFSDMVYENVLYAGAVKACLKARDAKQAEYDSLVGQLDNKRAALSTDGGSSQAHGMFGAVASLVDVDPEHTRRSTALKLRDQIATVRARLQSAFFMLGTESDYSRRICRQLESQVVQSAEQLRLAGEEVLAELRHFESEKTKDVKNLLILFAKAHLEHAKKV
jgi:hypothetical protein